MNSVWTILLTLLLAVLPAAGSFAEPGSRTDGSCSSCACCVQPQRTSTPTQSAPLSAPARSISVERFAQEENVTVAPTPRVSSLELLARAATPDLSCSSAPLFQRYCSLLI